MASTRLGCSGWCEMRCSAQWGCVTKSVRWALPRRGAGIVVDGAGPVVRERSRASFCERVWTTSLLDRAGVGFVELDRECLSLAICALCTDALRRLFSGV